jgi:hypothetical protein
VSVTSQALNFATSAGFAQALSRKTAIKSTDSTANSFFDIVSPPTEIFIFRDYSRNLI